MADKRPFTPAAVSKQRGFYSDLVTPVADGADGGAPASLVAKGAAAIQPSAAHRHLLSGATPTYVPTLPAEATQTPLDATSPPLDDDVPAAAYEPKVQRAFAVPAGEEPRKVMVERARQQFMAADLPALLHDAGIGPFDLLPGGCFPPRAAGPATPHAPFLPLELFDDTEFDPRTPEEWLALGVDPATRHMRGVPAVALLPVADPAAVAVAAWTPVRATAFDAATSCYTVTPRGDAAAAAAAAAAAPLAVPRVHLRFLAEDPARFVARVAAALGLRAETEGRLLAALVADCLPLDGLPVPPADAVARVVARAVAGTRYRAKDAAVARLVAETTRQFARAAAAGPLLQAALARGAGAASAVADALVLPPAWADADAPALLPVPAPWPRDPLFAETRARVQALTFFNQPEVTLALLRVRAECAKVLPMHLFCTTLSKAMRLDEFRTMQQQTYDAVQGFLRNQWVPAVQRAVSVSLGGVGKGWFNLQERNQEVYDVSKLRRLMRLVRIVMQDTLHSLVEGSLLDLTRLVERAGANCLAVPADRPVAFDFAPGTLFTTQFKPPLMPLFSLELVIDPATQAFTFSVPVGPFEAGLLSLFEAGIGATAGLDDIEPILLKQLFWVGSPTLQTVPPLAGWVGALRERVRAAIRASTRPLLAYAAQFERYRDLVALNVDTYLKSLDAVERDVADVKAECLQHMRLQSEVEAAVPASLDIGLFRLSCDRVRRLLADKRKALAVGVLQLLGRSLRKQADGVCGAFNDISQRLHERPNGIEDLTEQREYMKTVPEQLAQLQTRMDRALADWELLNDFNCGLSDDDANVRWTMVAWPRKLQLQQGATVEQLATDETKFKDNLAADLAAFDQQLRGLQMTVAGFGQHDNLARAEAVAVEVRKITATLKECSANANTYNLRQRLFGLPVTEYDLLGKVTRDFEPYRNLWLTADDWLKAYKVWVSDSFLDLNAEALEAQISAASKTMAKTCKAFREQPAILAVAEQVQRWVADFQPHVPLIQALRNPGMRDRHWEQLSATLGFALCPDKSFTFARCLELGLPAHLEAVTRVGELAGKEYSIEQALDKMEREWAPLRLDVVPYKETGTGILRSTDDFSQLLDDHIVMTQAMTFSPFKKPFELRLFAWENKLRVTQDVVEEWLACQRAWLYLEPIFSSDDIARQLPTESKRYQNMDRMWRKTMDGATKTPEVLQFCANPALLETFRECNKLLDQVQKGLSAYLETKRGIFARFYFLSDDELLEILSQTKDPTAVQPHMRKCFDNIAKLKFEKDLQMSAFISAEGEAVAFNTPIYPKGNVEDWLLEVEAVMRLSLREIFFNALEAMAAVARDQWVLEWPGQIVIAGCQTQWSAEVTLAIEAGPGGLPAYFDKMCLQLADLVRLVRGDLGHIQREILSALIVIEVHARDVVETMVKQGVSKLSDFEWISQLRYYWEADAAGEEDLRVKAVNAVFNYGYEYLGNSGRLVITPLTDRCYLTLTGALALVFGGAPAGPAGTGKTETTKDLAKALAVQCVVFNCSDQLDFLAMGKFFKGLASAGAWACFDEFNRIDIEVLSVVAQQVSTIQLAIKAKEKRFMFEGVDLALRPSCASFITMNPGYAGRTELPDNLAALFRPVAMMVPDYGMIAEIMLYSFGFNDAKALSKKIVTVFKLSSEQLSSQDHYDFGMRAVKTVISAAGNLKRSFPDMPEDVIVLRAILDVNVPKFLVNDLKLFNGIVSDLFPTTKMQEIDYGIFKAAIAAACAELHLQPTPDYVTKVIQLYETTVVRHGLMLVGPCGSGKTECYKVLQAALSAMAGTTAPNGKVLTKVHSFVLNPKAITMGQLYGQFDALTHEWTDGILSTLIRQGVAAQTLDKKWYVFDGPVDAVWIENMNTVLDDNKKLCLASGEIIALTPVQTMMFEVEDLTVASPATVSRCGMVYLEPSILGLQPFITSWLSVRLPPPLLPLAPALQALFDAYLAPALRFLRKEVREMVPTVDSNLCFSLMKLLDCFFAPFRPREGAPPVAPLRLAALPALLEPWFLFALVWTVGATCYQDGRRKFDAWLRAHMAGAGCALPFPAEGLVYDYCLVDDGGDHEDEHAAGGADAGDAHADDKPVVVGWKPWMRDEPTFVADVALPFARLIVPTLDTVRTSALLGLLLGHQKPVLVVGPTGSAKTVTISHKLLQHMPARFISNFIAFSARTSANQTQDMIDNKLDKRRKGVFGPPLGKQAIFFIDDLNMPAKETYGAQPPIEILRQFLDHNGWYDRKSIGTFRALVDLTLCGAMGPPGGGRNPVTQRMTRHFNFLAMPEMSDASKEAIFRPILGAALESFDPTRGTLAPQLVRMSIAVYNAITSELLPTPAKVHYTFNLRDLSKVFQGMLMADLQAVLNSSNSAAAAAANAALADAGPAATAPPGGGEVSPVTVLLRVWVHECRRVFRDRLINGEDRSWFETLVKGQVAAVAGQAWESVVPREPLVFGDHLDLGADTRKYVEMADFARVTAAMAEALDDYNASTTAPMKLVLFQDAVEHAVRLGRILRQPLGNALCLGVGGSGRQSMTRLAAAMADYECFQIELSKNYGVVEWRDDVKKVLKKAGLEDKPVVFLFSDTQIKSESFLEDLNNVLNSGDVPGIYDSSEEDEIYVTLKPYVQSMGLNPTKSNLFNAYCQRVRANIHTVICMSPIGEVFRARLRQFPALVNCCTIDWYSEWPDEALRSVALAYLSELPELDTEAVLSGVVNTCVAVHQTVVQRSTQFMAELGRKNYVTPTAYLELLGTFAKLLGKKKQELLKLRARTANGLEKLLATAKEVAFLQEELTAMQPMLKEAAEETAKTMAQIAEDKAVAEVTATQVAKEEAEASVKAADTKAMADDAQRDLDEALPALDAALTSLKLLNKGDITEVKAMANPPAGVKLVMEAVCILQDVKPKIVNGEKPGTKVNDYWSVCGPLLANPQKFLDSLFEFDKDAIPEATIKKIKPYIDNPDFTPAAIAKVSRACTSICAWCRAMYKYYHVSRSVAPKREALRQANEDLQQTLSQLAEAKARLKAVQQRIAEMETNFAAMVEKKQQLEAKAEECSQKLERAEKLIHGLGDEKGRWQDSVADFDKAVANVVGDMVVSAGTIAYLGPFVAEYRQALRELWLARLLAETVPHTPHAQLVTTLSDPVVIREWQLHGLPRDALSVENACVVRFSARWPLFIDPQAQANKWIKEMEGDKLVVMKLTDRDFLRSLENAVRFGSPCLLENVGEELDPALEPILLRQTFKQAGSLVIKLGDSTIPYHEDFKFYVTTKLPNPHYTPEVSTKVTVINFTLSPSGLEDQMLGLVVAKERPDLEEAKNALIISNAQMKGELKSIEDKILKLLEECKGSPVDDEELIQTLDASKLKSAEIQAKVKVAEETELDIDQTRSLYVPVAARTQVLFFCTTDLANVDPMYQYSLEWFRGIFLAAVEKAAPSPDVATRIDNINDYFTFSLYSNVCRSLFERHKLLFSFLLCTRIMQNDGLVDPHVWRFLLSGGLTTPEALPNPAPAWLPERAWLEVLMLPALPAFADFARDFGHHLPAWQRLFDAAEPHRLELPGRWATELDGLQKLLVLRCLRLDKVVPCMQDFVAAQLGQRFIEPQTANLSLVFPDSTPASPLIFVLSDGTDPASDLYKFAEEMGFNKKLSSISLGQGQGPRAEAMFKAGMERGTWVFFQNCHLAPSWMPTLERLIENIDPHKVHRDFRLWLTSMPSPRFPVSILQNGTKMTVEPPRGIKANLLEIFDAMDDARLQQCTKEADFKKLMLSLCLCHGILLERRKFGSLGFNIRYAYTKSDLAICQTQLGMFLDDNEAIPFKVLVYTAGHINYGGRVTDDWDRRCQMTIIKKVYNEEVLHDDHKFSPSGVYHQLPPSDHAAYLSYIRTLPINDTPEIFGLHDNANITFANNETNQLLDALLRTGGGGGGGGGGGAGKSGGDDRDTVLEKLANEILAKVPKPFDTEEVMTRHPVRYEESMNTVLIQEVMRFNQLLRVIHSSLQDLLKALKGLVVMSENLERLAASVFTNAVPKQWASVAYPSLKPLAAWVVDLLARVAFIQKWHGEGIPPAFWISGFFFPQAFLTGTLQNYARRNVVSIDTLSFQFDVLVDRPPERPAEGCYVYGLFLEGARWDPATHALGESRAKELFTEMPSLWLRPVRNRVQPSKGIYMCPCYKTLTRAGTLSTTGHSTNFVLAIEVPSSQDPDHWIQRGVALICALNY